MVVLDEDVVQLRSGKKAGDPFTITVNCVDRLGLGSDICQTILGFGLCICNGDAATDGKWCYIVLRVNDHCSLTPERWENLRCRLLSLCPSYSFLFCFRPVPSVTSPVYLLKFFSLDRKGLLHDVTCVLTELELIIQRVKVSTTPDGRVMDLFFVTDSLELLHTKERQDATSERLNYILGDSCLSCEIQMASPDYDCPQPGFSFLTSTITQEIFTFELSDNEDLTKSLPAEIAGKGNTVIQFDNSFGPAHTLLKIHCIEQKCLVYDIMRTLKDCNVQIAYGRFASPANACRDVDLFIQQNGQKIVDPIKQDELASQLKMEILQPLRIVLTNRGPDTELVVANPVESCGKGRPRVFYDITLALKKLGICIFSAEIGRHSTSNRDWEVYRCLLDDAAELPLSRFSARKQIKDAVRRTAMGW